MLTLTTSSIMLTLTTFYEEKPDMSIKLALRHRRIPTLVTAAAALLAACSGVPRAARPTTAETTTPPRSTASGSVTIAASSASPTITTGPRTTTSKVPKATEATLVWVGHGEAYRIDAGREVRVPLLDYEFEVLQQRNGRAWHSTKNLHRTAADYDGSAGEREQLLRFDLLFAQPTTTASAAVASSLGVGVASGDREFRSMQLHIDLEPVTPLYNTFSISQNYDYEAGRLTEVVELSLTQPDGTAQPVFRMRESAKVFAPTVFDHPPTVAD
jgi:hypothetical protein